MVSVDLPAGQDTELGEVLGGKMPITIYVEFRKPAAVYSVEITYQACSEGSSPMCFAPETLTMELPVMVKGSSSKIEEMLLKALSDNLFFALLIVFVGGILASFTPCVYPVIPLTMAYVGARSHGKKISGFLLSLLLVLGIATTYSLLGVVSARAGSLFGSFAQQPVFLITMAFIISAMGLFMFGYFEFQIPYAMSSKLHVEKKGFFGAFLVGMASGVLAAPCVGSRDCRSPGMGRSDGIDAQGISLPLCLRPRNGRSVRGDRHLHGSVCVASQVGQLA
ncbi:MAG: hypothetical protein MZV49_13250 [Rhodopseudomonas palustris]|nr:hypothetical protein [Rhodopseudomonas palustris]